MGKKVKGTACVNCVYYNATGISMPKEDESEGYCLDACHNKNNIKKCKSFDYLTGEYTYYDDYKKSPDEINKGNCEWFKLKETYACTK